MRLKYESEIRGNAAWSFETARFFIGFYAEPEDTDPKDSFDHPDDIAFARQDIDGHWFCARVSVFLKDENPLLWRELGSDYLGGCSYHSVREFAEDRQGYFPNMVREAVRDARDEIENSAALARTMRVGA